MVEPVFMNIKGFILEVASYIAAFYFFGLWGLVAMFIIYVTIDAARIYRKDMSYLPKTIPIGVTTDTGLMKVCPECRRLHDRVEITCVKCYQNLVETSVSAQVFYGFYKQNPKH